MSIASNVNQTTHKNMKNIPIYRITTPYGKWYECDNRGYVIKCSNGLDNTEANLHELMRWQITGIRAVDNFGRLSSITRLDEAAGMDKIGLLHKNGKPRYTIEDIDHGTTRVHGNIKAHGVKTVSTI